MCGCLACPSRLLNFGKVLHLKNYMFLAFSFYFLSIMCMHCIFRQILVFHLYLNFHLYYYLFYYLYFHNFTPFILIFYINKLLHLLI